MSRAQRGKDHTPQEWEAIKGIFLRLYTKDGLPLEKVMAIIAARHGFYANIRQYKTRIQQWKAYKSKTAVAPFPNGSQGCGVPDNTLPFGSGQDAGDISEAINAFNLTLFWPTQSPGHLRAMELVTLATRDVFQDAQRIMLDCKTQNGLTVPHKPAGWALGQFYLRGQTISALMSLSDSPERTRLLELLNIEIKGYIDQLIEERYPSPIDITCILQLCCRFWQDHQLPALQALLQYMVQRAAARAYGRPIHLLCEALLSSLDVCSQITVFTARRATEASSFFLAPHHPQTLSAHRGLYSALLTSGDFVSAWEVSNSCISREAEFERDDQEATTMWRVDAQVRLARCELSMNRLDDAEVHICELAGSIEAIKVESRKEAPWKLWFTYFALRGELLRLQGDFTAASVLEEAYSVARENCPPSDWWYVIYAKRHMEFARDGCNRWIPFPLPT